MKISIRTNGFKNDSVIQELAIPDILEIDSIKKSQLLYLYNNNIPFDNLIIFFEMPKADLDNDVPSNFIKSSKNIGTDENPTWVQKTWREYTLFVEEPDPGTDCLLTTGWRSVHKNRPQPVLYEEMKIWVDYFGVTNVIFLNEAKDLLNTKYAGE